MTDYPSDLPCPQVQGYQLETDHNVTAVVFEHGNRRVRRSASYERVYFKMSLVLSIAQLGRWQSWANANAYNWHWMSLTSPFAGLQNEIQTPHYIRYIGNIRLDAVDANYIRASFDAEMDPDTLPQGVITKTGNWVIGGTPAAPSNANRMIAGTPAAPSSTNWIIAGSPAQPAA